MSAYQYVYHMDGVSKTYPGGKKCFENIHLSFLPGVKIGVVGVNGSGKSTLMKIMAGIDSEYSGEAWAAKGARVGYLPQEPSLDETLDVRGNVMLGVKDKKDILDKYNELAMNYSEETADEMAQLQDEIDTKNLWDLDAQIDISLEALRCPADDAKVETLSGGEKRRVALCKLLLEEPDMLLLDEPTNHLDLATLDWLEEFLISFEGALLIVSHDRYFLDRVCNAIVEVQDTRAKGYHGNYTSFLQQKELFLQRLADRIKKTEAEVKRLTGALQSMKRANKYDKSISQKRFLLARAQGEFRWLKSLKPRQRRGLNFRLESTEKSSLEVLDFHNATLTFEGLNRPIIKGLEVAVSRGQKIGIVGPNGAGKTTLLRLIQGELKLDSGTINVRPGVQIGYFHQDHRSLNFDLTPVEQVRALKPRMDYGDIRALLGRFQFTSEMVETKLEKLSGGERARIAMLKLLLEDNNLLLLDEPTNHLDTDANEALEEALVEYDGSIITVSHDRFFLDRICDTVWELPADGSLWIWPGNYSDYIRRKRASESQ